MISVDRDAGGCTLTVAESAPILADCHIGDSIAVNGACLTVTEFDKESRGGWFKVWLANETLDRTDLGTCVLRFYLSGIVQRRHARKGRGRSATRSTWSGRWVRMFGLEDTSCRCASECESDADQSADPAQAHVDTTATIVDCTSDGESLRLLFQLPEPTPERPSLLPYIIPKGYIAIDGTSLTITQVDDQRRAFGVMLIKHTQEKITLSKKPVGAKVNIEVDMVGKFVEKSVHAALSGGGSETVRGMIEKVVEEVLAKKGIAS